MKMTSDAAKSQKHGAFSNNGAWSPAGQPQQTNFELRIVVSSQSKQILLSNTVLLGSLVQPRATVATVAAVQHCKQPGG